MRLHRGNRLHFGISAATGIFQRLMEALHANVPGVVILLHVILISGQTRDEHAERVVKVLRRLGEASVRP